MRLLNRYFVVGLLALTLCLMSVQQVYAHLMVAQHGTLNLIGKDVFMVLSLPISAFEGIDEDNDGKVTMVEFNNHRGEVVDAIRQEITLGSAGKNAVLEGLVLSPVQPHNSALQVISQLVVMGRFTLDDPAGALRFQVGLYGRQTAQQTLEVTATRKYDSRKAIFELTPSASAAVIFPEDG